MRVFDAARAQAFAGSILGVLNHGALSLMLSLGHRAGIFDAMVGLPPSTSAEIAAAAGLNERYVREWLGAMVTGKVVEIDEASRLYWLPPEHAACLTRAAGPDNLASTSQYLPMLGGIEDAIVECFQHGGGVAYDKYPRFQSVVAEGSAQAVVASLESYIFRLVPGLASRLQSGIRVLDLGCGSGRILNHLAQMFPASHFSGIDLSAESIGVARTEARTMGLTNAEFLLHDLINFHETAADRSFDWIVTFDAVHDQAWPLNLLRGVHRALADDGIFLMQEIKASSYPLHNIGHPIGTLLYAISTMHCMPVSLAQGGEGVGAMWGEEKARDYLARAGFTSVAKHEIPHDIQNNWYVVRK